MVSLDSSEVIDLSDSPEKWFVDRHIVIDCCGKKSDVRASREDIIERILEQGGARDGTRLVNMNIITANAFYKKDGLRIDCPVCKKKYFIGPEAIKKHYHEMLADYRV